MEISVICLLDLPSNTAFWSVKQMAFWILSSLQRRAVLNTSLQGIFQYMRFSSCYIFSILKGGCKILPPFLSIGWKSWCRKAACKTTRTRSRQINSNRAFEQNEKILFIFVTFFFLFELCNASWSRKWKINHPKFREKDIFLLLLASVAQFRQFIHLPGWLAFCTMHTSFHFTPLVTYFCCLVTQLQLRSYLSHRWCFSQVSSLA